MTKKSNMNPETTKKFISRLKMAMALRDVTQVELARRCGVTTAAVTQWVKGTTMPSLARIEQIAIALNVKVDTLITQNEASGKQYLTIPIYKLTGRFDTNKVPVSFESVPLIWSDIGEHFGLQITDDSLAPEIKNGDIAIIRVKEDIPDNSFALVCFNNLDYSIKKILRVSGGVILSDSNAPTFHPDKDFEDNTVKLVGQVVEIRRKLI